MLGEWDTTMKEVTSAENLTGLTACACVFVYMSIINKHGDKCKEVFDPVLFSVSSATEISRSRHGKLHKVTGIKTSV